MLRKRLEEINSKTPSLVFSYYDLIYSIVEKMLY